MRLILRMILGVFPGFSMVFPCFSFPPCTRNISFFPSLLGETPVELGCCLVSAPQSMNQSTNAKAAILEGCSRKDQLPWSSNRSPKTSCPKPPRLPVTAASSAALVARSAGPLAVPGPGAPRNLPEQPGVPHTSSCGAWLF